MRARLELRCWAWSFLSERAHATIPFTLPASEKPVFNNEGSWLFAIGEAGTPQNRRITVWDLGTQKQLFTLKNEHVLNQLALSPDERWLVAGDEEGYVSLWNLDKRSKQWSVKVHERRVDGIDFSPDGRYIGTASFDGSLKLLDAATGAARTLIDKSSVAFRKVAFSPDGRWLATSKSHGRQPAMLVGIASQRIVEFPGDGHVLPTFSPDGGSIATGNLAGSISLWEFDGNELREFKTWNADPENVQVLEFSIDGSQLISGHRRGSVKVWDIDNETEAAVIDVADNVYWLAMRPNSGQIAVFTNAGGIHFWQYERPEEGIRSQVHTESVRPVLFSPDGESIAVGEFKGIHFWRNEVQGGPVRILDSETGRCVQTLEGSLHGASWTLDGRHILASAEPDYVIRLYDVETGISKQSFAGHSDRAFTFVDPRSGGFVSYGEDGQLYLRDIVSGAVIRKRSLHQGYTGGFEFSSDSRRFAFAKGFYVRNVDVLEVEDEGSSVSLDIGYRWVFNLKFINAGRQLFVGSHEGRLSLFDIEANREIKEFVGHRRCLNAIAVSPDERQIVASDDCGQTIVWDVESGRPIVTLTPPGVPVTSLDWSRDRRRIVAGFKDGSVPHLDATR